MPERLLIAAVLIILGIIAYRILTAFQSRKARTALSGLENRIPGVPLILYFTLPTCVACNTAQAPALRSLQEALGDKLQIITIDAAAQPDMADQWGVMSVPTTYIFDVQDNLLAHNLGVAHTAKLETQLGIEAHT